MELRDGEGVKANSKGSWAMLLLVGSGFSWLCPHRKKSWRKESGCALAEDKAGRGGHKS